ncbi:hypothetical protein FUA26_04650 [Seonamhaeicola algicola]|uniref:Uncharacterized protein n=1 Tax=Seonamhaeicola algicola TaxID=1719036 RepID=A0A5C7AWL1_9FLAO|nr:hypothetical protein [Seonamhaeicola algicola]TXE13088.1 hypothetical protein FUA26_04650 [Seonamhaeicola algicola]
MTASNFEIKPLSSQDRNKLKKQYLFAILFLLVASAIFYFIYAFVIKPDNFSTIPIVMFSMFLLFFAGIFSYIFWNTYIDLKRGVKHCYTGIISDKRIDKHTTKSRSYNTGLGTNTRHKSNRTYYYISIDNNEHSVPYSEYAKVSVNDKVYLESSPKSKEVLAFTVLEKHLNSANNITNSLHVIPFKSKSITKPMRQQEIELVKKLVFKKIRKNTIYFLLSAMLLFVLWTGFILFLIPLIIAFIYYAITALIQLNQYTKFKRNGCLKTISKVQVIDKLKTTSNKHSTGFKIKTNNGIINVTALVYNKIQASQYINLHKASIINIMYDVSFDEHI